MATDAFFRNVRSAVCFVAPTITKDNPFSRPSDIEKALLRQSIWLTPKAVEGFEAADLRELPEQERKSLEHDVKDFVMVAKRVPGSATASTSQIQAAAPPFLKIVLKVQKLTLQDWRHAGEALVGEAEQWAGKREWPAKRYAKEMSEDFLGNYALPRLLFAVRGTQLTLNPVGRFASGTDGLFELAVLPAYESFHVIRKRRQWSIHLASSDGEEQKLRWVEEGFAAAVEALEKLA